MLSVSAIKFTFNFYLLPSSFSLSSASGIASPGTLYVPVAQRARSCSLHRSLQNGRHLSSTGCRRQSTHNGGIGIKNPTIDTRIWSFGHLVICSFAHLLICSFGYLVIWSLI